MQLSLNAWKFKHIFCISFSPNQDNSLQKITYYANFDKHQKGKFKKEQAWLMSFCFLKFLANWPKSKRLNQKLCNLNLVLDAQSLHKAQWYSNRSYIFFFRFFSSSAITDVGWRNNGYCKFHNTITGKNFKFYMLLFNSICQYDCHFPLLQSFQK